VTVTDKNKFDGVSQSQNKTRPPNAGIHAGSLQIYYHDQAIPEKHVN
jgi:hypothetical protein